jgi:hypothetical protein
MNKDRLYDKFLWGNLGIAQFVNLTSLVQNTQEPQLRHLCPNPNECQRNKEVSETSPSHIFSCSATWSGFNIDTDCSFTWSVNSAHGVCDHTEEDAGSTFTSPNL